MKIFHLLFDAGRTGQQVKIVLLSFWSVNRWVSQFWCTRCKICFKMLERLFYAPLLTPNPPAGQWPCKRPYFPPIYVHPSSPPVTWMAFFPCSLSPQTRGATVHVSLDIAELDMQKPNDKNWQIYIWSQTCSEINCARSAAWVLGGLSEELAMPCASKSWQILGRCQY